MTVCLHNSALAVPGPDFSAACLRNRRIAESLQRVLLQTSPQEALPGLSTETFYESALDEAIVCGDSCDAFALADGRVALVVVDASGKGLGAAERAAEIRFALRAFLREHGDPCRALSCLNDFVYDAQRLGKRDDSTFATLTLVVLDSTTGGMLCLCAGGEPPLVKHADGTWELIPICGAALGLFRSQGYAAVSHPLEIGGTVLLVTDGLTEARNLASIGNTILSGPRGTRTGPFLGLEGLILLAPQKMPASLSEIGEAIFEGARRYAGGVFHDDACLLIGRRMRSE